MNFGTAHAVQLCWIFRAGASQAAATGQPLIYKQRPQHSDVPLALLSAEEFDKTRQFYRENPAVRITVARNCDGLTESRANTTRVDGAWVSTFVKGWSSAKTRPAPVQSARPTLGVPSPKERGG
jgi:hypothetical protein